MPLKMRAAISPFTSRPSTADSERSASTRTSSSVSTNLPSFFSSTPSSSVFVAPASLCASALIAARRVARSGLASWIDACVRSSNPLTSGSDSLAIAAVIAGSASSSALFCSSLAAARRTTRSADVNLKAAMAVASVRRRRLFTMTSSRPSGNGDTAAPVTASTAVSPLTMSTRSSPTVCTSPSISACSNGSAAWSPEATSMPMALPLASPSPNASSFTTSAGSAPWAAVAAQKIASAPSHRQ